jgi:hypothetical protein
MRVLIPDAHIEWGLFSWVLLAVGGVTVAIALLPSSWIERACAIGADTQAGLSLPMKLLVVFAGLSYLLTVGLDLVPHSWHLSTQIVYLLCPACVLSITVDPSLGSILFLLAPLNAVVYGPLGAVLGYLILAIRNRL